MCTLAPLSAVCADGGHKRVVTACAMDVLIGGTTTENTETEVTVLALRSKHIDIGDGEEIVKAYKEYGSEEQRMAVQNQIDNSTQEQSSHTEEKHPFTVETFPFDEKDLVLSDKWKPSKN